MVGKRMVHNDSSVLFQNSPKDSPIAAAKFLLENP